MEIEKTIVIARPVERRMVSRDIASQFAALNRRLEGA